MQWQQAGTETVERVEVTKSPTPDMPADSIGGAVNIVTKSAFDRSPERHLAGSYGVVWRPTDERSRPMPQWTVSYSEVFKGKFGVSLNYGYQPVESLIDGATQLHQALPAGVEGPAYTYSLDMRDSANKRTRWGGGLKLDYKLSGHSRFFVNVISNNHRELNSRESLYATAQTVAAVDANGNFTNANAIIPGYTDTMTQWRGVSASIVQARGFATHKVGRAWNYQVGGVHRYPTLEIDYDAYHSFSETIYPGNKTFTLIAQGIGLRLERKDEIFTPYITQLSGPDITKVSSYTDNTYTIDASTGQDKYWGTSLNAKKTFETAVPSYLKAGLRLREQTRNVTDTPWTGRYLGTNYGDYLNPDTRTRSMADATPSCRTPHFLDATPRGRRATSPSAPTSTRFSRVTRSALPATPRPICKPPWWAGPSSRKTSTRLISWVTSTSAS